jgi:hypothetical protein
MRDVPRATTSPAIFATCRARGARASGSDPGIGAQPFSLVDGKKLRKRRFRGLSEISLGCQAFDIAEVHWANSLDDRTQN